MKSSISRFVKKRPEYLIKTIYSKYDFYKMEHHDKDEFYVSRPKTI